MGLREELSSPVEEWTVLRHHIQQGTMSKVSHTDTQAALVEVRASQHAASLAYLLTVSNTQAVMQYDQLQNKLRAQSMQIVGFENDLRKANEQVMGKMGASVKDSLQLTGEVDAIGQEMSVLGRELEGMQVRTQPRTFSPFPHPSGSLLFLWVHSRARQRPRRCGGR